MNKDCVQAREHDAKLLVVSLKVEMYGDQIALCSLIENRTSLLCDDGSNATPDKTKLWRTYQGINVIIRSNYGIQSRTFL